MDPRAAAALEYLYAGDTAIVATQYSYLPSPVSFLFDDDQVEKEGPELFEAELGDPGSWAGRADAALFVGPPSSNRLWRDVVAGRIRARCNGFRSSRTG